MPFKKSFKKTVKKQYKKKRAYKAYTKSNFNMYFTKRYTGGFSVSTAASAGAIGSVGSTWSIVTPAVAGTNFYSMSMLFRLADLPGYTEFQAMYDMYKIVGVALRIFPLFSDSNTATTGSVQGLGLVIHSVIDLDDAGVPAASDAGVNALREYGQSYKCQNLLNTGKWSRYFRPKTAGYLVDSAGVSQLAAVNKQMWVNSAQPSIAHYGVKVVIETNTFSALALSASFKMEAKFYIKLKGQI